mgnify:CR=1 FL=1
MTEEHLSKINVGRGHQIYHKRGIGAHFSGFKLVTSAHVLSMLVTIILVRSNKQYVLLFPNIFIMYCSKCMDIALPIPGDPPAN